MVDTKRRKTSYPFDWMMFTVGLDGHDFIVVQNATRDDILIGHFGSAWDLIAVPFIIIVVVSRGGGGGSSGHRAVVIIII